MANKDNNEILNELFFKKKKSYSEKQKELMPQYSPVKKTDDVKSIFGGNSMDGFIVSDTDEVKKRVVGALSMAFGNNTVRSMANKAVKTFPIIVSDSEDISPETLVILKTTMEEQYASYIDLLVSNQIINISDYEADSSDGNIALQALNRLDGTDFSRGRLARKAQSGSLSIDDIMQNNPGWAFVRANENAEYSCGNAILDDLLEGAVIVPSEYANETAANIYDEIKNNVLMEDTAPYYGPLNAQKADDVTDDVVVQIVNSQYGRLITNTDCKVGIRFLDTITNKVYQRQLDGHWKLVSNPDPIDNGEQKKRLYDSIYGIMGQNNGELYRKYGISRSFDQDGKSKYDYDKLLTPSVMVDDDSLQISLDKSAAQILTGDSDTARFLKDRFEKACFLLAARRISGSEYISYVNDRLGIPISTKTRAELVLKYKTSDVEFKGYSTDPNLSVDKQKADMLRDCIAKNKKYVLQTAENITRITGKDILAVTAGTVTGGAIGAGVGGAAIAASIASAPILLPAIAGAALVGGIGTAIYRALTKRKINKLSSVRIAGWERVEQLIDEMDATRKDVIKKDSTDVWEKENAKLYDDFYKDMERILKTNAAHNRLTEDYKITNLGGYKLDLSEEQIAENLDFLRSIDEELYQDEETLSEVVSMNEAAKYVINTKKPGDIIVKQTKYNPKDIAGIVPMYGTRDTVAYGSVEYDRRDIKDRKFNEPLILTIKFKERYGDDKYSDSELTAVIGILGVVTRVPSNEMVEILRANAQGKTLSDFFKGDENNNAKDLIGNVIANFTKSKYAEKLPTSGKVWANLEKVTALAVANKLSGTNHGNISNAHIIFAQREINEIKNELGVDYLRNAKLAAQLMKRYSAFMLAVCDDVTQHLYTFTDPEAISWDVAPYSAYMGKSSSDQLMTALTQIGRMKI